MKKQLGSIASVFALSLFTLSSFAQETDKNVNQKVKGDNGTPNLITFKESSVYKNSDSQRIFKEQLGLKQNESFSRLKTESDKQGYTHEKFQLFHQGLKVEFATYTLHSRDGKLSSMSGEFYNIKDINTTPSLSQAAALNMAMAKIGAKHYLWENQADAKIIGYQKPQGELVLLPLMKEVGQKGANEIRLVYKFDIYATEPVSRGDIYIDAITGESLYYNPIIKHFDNFGHTSEGVVSLSTLFAHAKEEVKANAAATKTAAFVAANAATRYSGTQSIQTTLSGASYILKDNTRGSGVNTYNLKTSSSISSAVNFTDADNNWTAAEFNNTAKDNAGLDAHWGAEKTYDFWKTTFNRNSYNNSGAVLNSYVHYQVKLDNAYWDGSEMMYGDGNQLKILTAIDVCGHEIGHAVCQATAGLAYQRESGAMNEGFSDIWGACVEYYAAPTKSRWLIGEDIEQRAGHIALRSMSNPKAEGQPDTYAGTNWYNPNCGTPSQNLNDYCGVHTNSGILNHWFYILTDGKTGTNDIGSAYNVAGIGIDKAAQIAFRTESQYLSANSTYANARTYAIQAATDLYGAASAEVIATTNAWYAVGVGAAYVGPADTVAPSAPTNLAAAGTTQTTTNLSWTASTDNVGVTGYNVYQGTTLKATVATTSYAVTGLTASTAYAFSVKAKDAAGNVSAASNTVNVTTSAPVADTTAPTAPTALTASGTTATTTNLSWSASTDNVGVTGYNVYQGATLKATVATTSYAVTGLTAATAYTFSVKAKDAAGNVSAASNTVNVTTSSTSVTYCNSKGNSVADEFIDYVSLGGISNVTGANGGYGNFTNLVGNLVYGANPLIVSTGYTGSIYTEYWGIWIDFNKNGTFESTELVESGSTATGGNSTGTITVPTTALAGTTRMRVSMKYGSAPTPCETFSYGEVEDYTVNIGGGAISGVANGNQIGNESNVYDFNMYPNPVENTLNVSLLDNRTASYKIYNLIGQEIKGGNLNQKEISVSNLGAGVYIFEINDGQKTITKKFVKK